VNRPRRHSGQRLIAPSAVARVLAEKSAMPSPEGLEQVGEILQLLQNALDESRKTNAQVQADLERARWSEKQSESVHMEQQTVCLDRPITGERVAPRVRIQSGEVAIATESPRLRARAKASR
jgi:hypothetical protein